MKRQEEGITLIALIITIIILIILTAITISNVMGSNLFGLAKGAAQNYIDAGKKEQDAIDELISAAGEIGKGGNLEENKEDEELYKYILGPKEAGKERKRNLEEISNFSDIVDSWSCWNLQFIKDNTIETDISTSIKVLNLGYPSVYVEEEPIGYIYITYNNKVYRIIANRSNHYAIDLEKVYEAKGKEGEKIEYSYDGTEGNKKEWTIIKDNQDGTVEIVSPEVIGSLTLGKKGYTNSATTNANVETSINDYNESIKTINDECKKLVTNDNIKVRSVGVGEDKTGEKDTYISKRIKEWAETYPYLTTCNGRGKTGDTYYEDDLVRMSYHNVTNKGSEYWVASRHVVDQPDMVRFRMNYVGEDGFINAYSLWYIESPDNVGSKSYSLGVCPVVTIQYPVSGN